MKKAVLIIAALLLVSSFVFAQDAGVKVGAWGRGIFIPWMGGSTIMSDAAVSWGGAPRVGMTISGNSANAGFQADFNVDNAGLAVGDQQKIWIKPIDMLTVQIGRIYDDTLRGNAGNFGAWNWVRYSKMTGEDNVFARVGTAGQRNFEISITPIEGLYAFAGLGGSPSILGNALQTAGDVAAAGQYGAGYTIAGIGTIRAQYIGANKDAGVANAAFKLTAVDKLTVDVGGSLPLSLTDIGKTALDAAGLTAQFALGASYSLDTLVLNAMVNASIYKAGLLSANGDPALEFGAGADYGLGDGLTVNGDVRYANKVATASAFDNGEVGAMVGITKGFSNGSIGIGVEISTGNFSVGAAKANPNDVAWLIPIKMEYSF